MCLKSAQSETIAYLDVVELTSKGDLNHGDDSLLEQDTELALGVNLSSEAAGSEIVFSTESGNTLLLRTTHHRVSGGELEVEVNTSLELVGESSPVRTLDSTSRHELSAGDPILTLVPGGVADHGLGAELGSGSLVNGFQTEGESGGDALQVATDEDTSKGTVQDRGVHGLDLRSEVISNIVVLERELSASGTSHGSSLDLSAGLCDPARSPSVVEAGGEGKVAVEVTLAEDLNVSVREGRRNTSDRNTLLVP